MDYIIPVPGYHQELMSCMYQLQKKNALCDATFQCKGGEVDVHKLILMCCGSPYLQQQVSTANKDGKHCFVNLKDYSLETVCCLVQGLYTGEVEISDDNISEFENLCKFIGTNQFSDSLRSFLNKEENRVGNENQNQTDNKEGENLDGCKGSKSETEFQHPEVQMEELIKDFDSLPEHERELASPFIKDFPDSVTIKVGNAKIYVKKEDLMTASPVFGQMFTSQFKEASSNELVLPGKDVGHFVHFLRHILPGFDDILTVSVAHNLLPLAHEYLMDKLMVEINSCLSSHVKENGQNFENDDVIDSIIEADKYSLTSYLEECIKVASRKDYEELVKNPKFTRLSTKLQADIYLRKVLVCRTQVRIQTVHWNEEFIFDTEVYEEYGNCMEHTMLPYRYESYEESLEGFRTRDEYVNDEIYAADQQTDKIELQTGKYNNAYVEFSSKSDLFLVEEKKIRMGIQQCGKLDVRAKILVETIDGTLKAGVNYKPLKECIEFTPDHNLHEFYIDLTNYPWERETWFFVKISIADDSQIFVKLERFNAKKIVLKSHFNYRSQILPLIQEYKTEEMKTEIDSFLANIVMEAGDDVKSKNVIRCIMHAEKFSFPKLLEQCVIVASRKKYQKIGKKDSFQKISKDTRLKICLHRWEAIDDIYDEEEDEISDAKYKGLEGFNRFSFYGYSIAGKDMEIEEDEDELGLKPLMQKN